MFSVATESLGFECVLRALSEGWQANARSSILRVRHGGSSDTWVQRKVFGVEGGVWVDPVAQYALCDRGYPQFQCRFLRFHLCASAP